MLKRERECRSEEKVGGKRSTEDSELQTNQKGHPPLSSVSSPVSPVSSMNPVSSPMSPVTSPVSPVSSPVSPMLFTGDQVQATLPSSPPPKESGYLHYGIGELYFIKMYL